MLSWICPECGRECSPGEPACSQCTGGAVSDSGDQDPIEVQALDNGSGQPADALERLDEELLGALEPIAPVPVMVAEPAHEVSEAGESAASPERSAEVLQPESVAEELSAQQPAPDGPAIGLETSPALSPQATQEEPAAEGHAVEEAPELVVSDVPPILAAYAVDDVSGELAHEAETSIAVSAEVLQPEPVAEEFSAQQPALDGPAIGLETSPGTSQEEPAAEGHAVEEAPELVVSDVPPILAADSVDDVSGELALEAETSPALSAEAMQGESVSDVASISTAESMDNMPDEPDVEPEASLVPSAEATVEEPVPDQHSAQEASAAPQAPPMLHAEPEQNLHKAEPPSEKVFTQSEQPRKEEPVQHEPAELQPAVQTKVEEPTPQIELIPEVLPPLEAPSPPSRTASQTIELNVKSTAASPIAPKLPDPPPPEAVLPAVYSKRKFPTWIITLVVVTVASLVIASRMQKAASTNAAVTPTEAAVPEDQAPPPTPAKPEAPQEIEYPYARYVEVTGLRVVDQNSHPQVQYLVVNHSDLPLIDIGLRIAVRSAALGNGSEPLFRVSARVPKLGPHESKEIRMDLDTGLRVAQLPEWENLRTEVKLTSEQ